MKHVIIFFVVLLSLAQAQAQHPVKSFMLKYHRSDRVMKITVGRFPMMIARQFLKNDEDNRWISRIRKVQVITIEDGKSNRLQRNMNTLKNSLQHMRYDELMTVRDGGDDVRILARVKNDDEIRECVVFVNEAGGDATVVRVIGKLKLSELDNIRKKYSPEKKRSDSSSLNVVPAAQL